MYLSTYPLTIFSVYVFNNTDFYNFFLFINNAYRKLISIDLPVWSMTVLSAVSLRLNNKRRILEQKKKKNPCRPSSQFLEAKKNHNPFIFYFKPADYIINLVKIRTYIRSPVFDMSRGQIENRYVATYRKPGSVWKF